MNVQALIDTLNQGIADTAAELGCGPDNEAILRAIAKLKADRDALLGALFLLVAAERDYMRATGITPPDPITEAVEGAEMVITQARGEETP